MSVTCRYCFELLDTAGKCTGCGWYSDDSIEAKEVKARRERAEKLGIRPPVNLGNLWGADGNAWAILGACQAVFKSLGYKRDDPLLQAFRLEAMKGDYVHLLRTVDRLFTVSVSGYDTMEDFIDHYNAGPDSVSDSYVKQDHGLSPELVERHIADIKANLERAMKELTT